MIVDLHGGMLADRRRNAAFARAIRAAVRPGSTVVDAGCGTGILSLLCARAGAARVHALERDPALAALARENVRRNGLSHVIEVTCGDAREFRPPHPADLVVTETVGIFAFDEGILAIRDALAPRLAPGGRFLPGALRLHVAPIRSARLERAFARSARLLGFDYSARAEALAHRMLPHAFRAADLLAPALPAGAVDLSLPAPAELAFSGTFHAAPGRLAALGIHFDLDLFPGTSLSTAPGAPPTHWGRFLLPLPPVEVDGEVRASVRWHGAALRHASWTVEARGYCASGSTMIGELSVPSRS